jgi:hypothetical protein
VVRQKIEEAKQDFDILPLSLKCSGIFGVLKKSIKDSRKLNPENIKKHNIDTDLLSKRIFNDFPFDKLRGLGGP